MALNGFDKIASIYDGLARLVFGSSIKNAQLHFLNAIHPQAKILMLGGGTGWLLTELLSLKPECKVWYIEASKKMLELSKAKTDTTPRVHFIHGTEENLPSSIRFDAVITNFYLDLFPSTSLINIIRKIKTNLKSGSLWIATDFIYGNKWWQNILLKLMYIFFRLTCGIESKDLPDWNQAFTESGLKKEKSKHFYGNFIETVIYRA